MNMLKNIFIRFCTLFISSSRKRKYFRNKYLNLNNISKQQQQIELLYKKINEFNYKNNIKSFSFWNKDEYIVCQNLLESFIRQIDSLQFYKICCKYFAGLDLSNFDSIDILIYITSLLQNNKFEKALELLNKYVSIYGTNEIWRFIEVSKFAYEHQIKDELIMKSVIIYDKLKKSREKKVFENLIKDKTVAIVGNGPSELGKNCGKEIDSHDVVIRINNYQISGYEKDYGSKTDIWIKCTSDDINHDIRDKNIKLVMYESDFFRHPIIDNYIDALSDNTIPIDYFDFEDHVCLRKKLNIFPSTGLVAIEKILSQCNVKKLDCYGFSFKDDCANESFEHYFHVNSKEEEYKRQMHHSVNKEVQYLRKVLNV